MDTVCICCFRVFGPGELNPSPDNLSNFVCDGCLEQRLDAEVAEAERRAGHPLY